MAKIYIFKCKGERAMGKRASVFDVAKYFLSRAELEEGYLITHLKLQKLCYYAQAWHAVFENKPMFKEGFQAWAHGPACPELYNEYKDKGWYPIEAPEDVENSIFKEQEIETLESVWEAYGKFDAKYLEELTHQEDPWIIARGSCLPGDKCTNSISIESMKEYYAKLQ